MVWIVLKKLGFYLLIGLSTRFSAVLCDFCNLELEYLAFSSYFLLLCHRDVAQCFRALAQKTYVTFGLFCGLEGQALAWPWFATFFVRFITQRLRWLKRKRRKLFRAELSKLFSWNLSHYFKGFKNILNKFAISIFQEKFVKTRGHTQNECFRNFGNMVSDFTIFSMSIC